MFGLKQALAFLKKPWAGIASGVSFLGDKLKGPTSWAFSKMKSQSAQFALKSADFISQTAIYTKLHRALSRWTLENLEMPLDALKLLKTKKYSLIFGELRQQLVTLLNSESLSPRLKPYFQTLSLDGLLDVDEQSEEPPQVVILKKILNYLFEIESRIKTIEELETPGTLEDLVQLGVSHVDYLNDTMNKAWEMADFVVHLLEDSSKNLGGQIVHVLQLCTHAKQMLERQMGAEVQYSPDMTRQEFFYQAGMVTGAITDQLDRKSGTYNYGYIAQLSSFIPGYLENITQYIKSYSEVAPTREGQVNEEAQRALQSNAMNIARSFDRLRQGTFFLSAKIYHLVHIFQSAKTIVTAIVEQAGLVNQSVEQFIRNRLTQLNAEILPNAMHIIRDIEVELLLTPGTLARPAMQRFEEMYQGLVNYSENIVEFKPEEASLKTLYNKSFAESCADKMHKEVAQLDLNIMQLEHVINTARHFFEILEKTFEDEKFYFNLKLSDLPKQQKKSLLQDLKQIAPYVQKIDANLYNQMIRSLTRSSKKDTLIVMDIDFDEVLFPRLKREMGYYTLQKQLMMDEVNSNLIPEGEMIWDMGEPVTANLFRIDERQVFPDAQALRFTEYEEGLLLQDFHALSEEQILQLYQYHATNLSKLETAEKTWFELCALIRSQGLSGNFTRLDADARHTMLQLWYEVMPYVQSGLMLDGNDLSYIGQWSQKVSQALHSPEKVTDGELPDVTGEAFLSLSGVMALAFNESRQQTNTLLNDIAEHYKFFKVQSASEQAIQPDKDMRAEYVLKNTYLSKSLGSLREKLTVATQHFNKDVVMQLQQAKSSGVPFPEAERDEVAPLLGHQTLMLMRLHNVLYRLESTSSTIESFTEKDFKINAQDMLNKLFCETGGTFQSGANRLFNVAMDMTQVYFALCSMSEDPYFAILGESLQEALNHCFAAISGFVSPHIAGQFHAENELQPTNSGIYSGLATLFVLPEQVAAVAHDTELSESHIRRIHLQVDQVAKEVQTIIDRSGSLFKLFLSTPKIYGLFKTLRAKLHELTDVTYDAVTENIQHIYETLLKDILIQADEWEENLSLRPGIISNQLQEIYDVFYQGILLPLDQPYEKHLAIATSTVPIDKRIQANESRKEETIFNERQTQKHLVRLKEFSEMVKGYRETKVTYGVHSLVYRQARDQLLAAYESIYPILMQERHRVDEQGFMYQLESTDLDDLLNSSQLDGKPIAHIEAFITEVQRFFQGICCTWQTKKKAIEEEGLYLEAQRQNHAASSLENFRARYPNQLFEYITSNLIRLNFDCEYVSKEYKAKMTQKFNHHKAEIIERAQDVTDMKAAVTDAITAVQDEFYRQNRDDFLILENLTKQIIAFRAYFEKAEKKVKQNGFSFESLDTLNDKKDVINVLAGILEDTSSPVKSRLTEASAHVHHPHFTRTLLNQHQYHILTLKRLWQGILNLLNWLGLRKFEHEKIYHELKENCPTSVASSQSFFAIPKEGQPQESESLQQNLENQLPV